MSHPQFAPAEQDVGLHPPKPEFQGIVEGMGVGVIVVGVCRQDRAEGASGCLTTGRTWTDDGRGDETRENAPTSCSNRHSWVTVQRIARQLRAIKLAPALGASRATAQRALCPRT